MSKALSIDDIEILLTVQQVKVFVKEHKYYVYVIYGGIDGPLYIGKGTGRRVLVHEAQALQKYDITCFEDEDNQKVRKFSKLKRLAYHLSYDGVRYHMIPCASEKQALQLEFKLVAQWGMVGEGVLSNLVSGGTGAKVGGKTSIYTRKRISKALKGHVVSDVTRQRISAALFGVKRPPEFGEIISKALTGRVIPLETRLKMGKARIGIPRTEATKQKVSASRLKSDKIKRIPVKINNKTYASASEAGRKLGISHNTIRYRISSPYWLNYLEA